MPGNNDVQTKIVEEIAVDSLSDEEKQYVYRSQAQLLTDKFCDDQGSLLNEIVQDIVNKCTFSICLASHQIESIIWSMPLEAVLNITKENRTLQLDMEILGSV